MEERKIKPPTPRWSPLRYHPEQHRYWTEKSRFKTVPAGRRSGKCIAHGTKILMSDYSTKRIQDIVVGDRVWSIADDHTLYEDTVTARKCNGNKACLRISTCHGSIISTPNHKYLTATNTWVEAKDLKQNDLVYMLVDVFIELVSITHIREVGVFRTYDLTIERYHSFIANNFVVHNSELAKRKVVREALKKVRFGNGKFHNARFAVCAPVYPQAKKIYWDDLQALIPSRYILKVKESELYLKLSNNVEIHVIGMDKPARIEGQPWDGVIVDEFADMKPQAFSSHIRPALADRGGWCDLIGVPEGRNHYYELVKKSIADTSGEWTNHHWVSADILDPAEIRSAKMLLDEVTFNIEYNASFDVNVGVAYYAYNPTDHLRQLYYNAQEPLIFCFDFNVDPGIAAVIQEQILPGAFEYIPNPDVFGTGMLAMQKAIKSTLPDALIRVPVKGSGVIDEVWIDHSSNTYKVCEALLEKYGNHQGLVFCYGDATGGAKGSAKLDGSDWDIIKKTLSRAYKDRLRIMVGNSNPSTRARKNAMNSRLKTVDGTVRMMVDKDSCPHFILDLEGTMLKSDGSGDIDKVSNPKLTHMCFAGDTLVKTNKGVQALKSIDKTGWIATPYGIKKYFDGGRIRGQKRTIYVYLANGTYIDCTEDHLILTNRGWMQAKDVSGKLCYVGNNDLGLVAPSSVEECRRILAYDLPKGDYSEARILDSGLVQNVYCPTVEVGCFYLANGLLVSNSDAVGYYVADQFPLYDSTLSAIEIKGRY